MSQREFWISKKFFYIGFSFLFTIIIFFPNILFTNSALNNAVVLSGFIGLSFLIIIWTKTVSSISILYIYFTICLSFIHSFSILKNIDVGLIDFADIFRNLSFVIFFLVGASVDRLKFDTILSKIFDFTTLTLFVLLILSYGYRDIFDDLELFYGKIDNVVGGRFFVPFYNPYDLGLFLILPFVYYLLKRRIFHVFLTVFLIFGTQSRTAIILTILILFLLFIRVKSTRPYVLWFLLSLLTILFIIYLNLDIDLLNNSYFFDNTVKLIEGESTTLEKRFSQWSFSNFEILGLGLIRTDQLMIENGYLYELLKFGLFSVFSILFYYIIPLLVSLKVWFYHKGHTNLEISIAIWIIAFVIGSNANVFLYQVKLSFIYWLMLGFFLNSVRFSLNPINSIKI